MALERIVHSINVHKHASGGIPGTPHVTNVLQADIVTFQANSYAKIAVPATAVPQDQLERDHSVPQEVSRMKAGFAKHVLLEALQVSLASPFA